MPNENANFGDEDPYLLPPEFNPIFLEEVFHKTLEKMKGEDIEPNPEAVKHYSNPECGSNKAYKIGMEYIESIKADKEMIRNISCRDVMEVVSDFGMLPDVFQKLIEKKGDTEKLDKGYVVFLNKLKNEEWNPVKKVAEAGLDHIESIKNKNKLESVNGVRIFNYAKDSARLPDLFQELINCRGSFIKLGDDSRKLIEKMEKYNHPYLDLYRIGKLQVGSIKEDIAALKNTTGQNIFDRAKETLKNIKIGGKGGEKGLER